MEKRTIGPFTVANVALGCMNFCHAYGNPVSTEQAHAVLHAALEAGVLPVPEEVRRDALPHCYGFASSPAQLVSAVS